MHKYRAAATHDGWYGEEDDPNPKYNPFSKTRNRYEDESLVIHRAQPLQVFSSPSRSNSDEEVPKGKQAVPLEAEDSSHADDEAPPEESQSIVQIPAKDASELKAIHGSLDEEHGISMPPQALASWQAWSQRKLSHLWRQLVLASGSRRSGDVKRSVADMGKSVISHAPLGTKGALFLQGPSRRRRFMVIEYAKQGDGIKGATTGVGGKLPGPRFHEKQLPRDGDKRIPDNHQVKSKVITLCNDLSKHLSSRAFPKGSPNLRIIYIQDGPESFRHIYENFHFGFARHRTDFLEWSTGKFEENIEQQAARQTDFWRPTGDRTYDIVRTAFGLEYLVARPLTFFNTELNGGVSRKSTTESSKMEPKTVPDCCLQRLSVFIQSNKTEDPSVQLGPAVKDRLAFTLDNSVIIFDSMYKGVPTGELISGRGAWQQLHEDLESVENPILSATIQLVFDTVAGKWSDYILSMHNYIVALEETIYDQPADDTRAPALWSISKQLLQAERLMKFHVLLLENVQRDLTEITGNTTRPDWLGQNLNEFNRLSSEVEETLKKPVAHMVDLMYKSISIRDARQSLELNTSMWRLSWITFIFLPLTFLAGVFGMNVSELKANPPLKWYFITASPLMVLVMISWLSARRWMRKDVDTTNALHQRHTSAF